MSAAATLDSSCATLDAPGMATVFGWCTTHASATWDGVASCADATSRRVSVSGASAARFSGSHSGLLRRTALVGRWSAS